MEPKIIDEGFKTVLRLPLPEKEGLNGMADLSNASQFQIGVGNRAMKVDRTGQWLGGNRFEDAPFSVDIDGNVIAESLSLSSSVTIASSSGLNQTFTTSTPTLVTGSSFTVELERQLRVFIIANSVIWVANNSVGDYRGNGVLALYINGGEYARTVGSGGTIGTDTSGVGNSSTAGSIVLHNNRLLAAGSYTIQLRAHIDATVGSPKLNIYNYGFSLITLGTT